MSPRLLCCVLLAPLVLGACRSSAEIRTETASAEPTPPARTETKEPAQDPLAELRKEAARAFGAGEWADAAELYGKIVAAEPANAAAWFRHGYALHALGDYKSSVAAFERSHAHSPSAIAAYDVACARARLGEVELALSWLDKSVALGMQDLATMSTDKDLDGLRSTPRFQELLRTVQEKAQPCVHRTEARQFDFWIGEWSVTTQAGARVGDSKIELILGQCVLLENWTGLGGGSGKSFNVFDANARCRKQTWVDDKGSIIEFRDGRLVDGAMVFQAETPAPGGGSPIRRRLSFFDQGPDRVRQFSEQSRDGGTTWTTEYDFVYVRKPVKT